MRPVRSYIRTQGAACAVINAVLNPTIAWLGNRQMAYVLLSGDKGIVVDTAVTSVVLSLLVSLFVTPAVRRELRAGKLAEAVPVSWDTRVLSHMPGEAWSFGLLTGIGAAVILTPMVFGSLRILGMAGLPFVGFSLLKAAYTAALGFVVTRLVILRQLLPPRSDIIPAQRDKSKKS